MVKLRDKESALTLRKWVFFPPWILLVIMVGFSLISNERFVYALNIITNSILDNFAWLFNMTTILSVFTVIIVYFSPLGNVRIGGRKAKPMMSFTNLTWITLCTTIAAGILFWAAAEPLYHMYEPAIYTKISGGNNPDAALFAIQTMFLEWTWSPYALYTVATLIFAFAFYNMNLFHSIGSALIPVFGLRAIKYNAIVDIICCFSLVVGMAASLGTGTLTIAGGIQNLFDIKSAPFLWAIIIAIIVITFVISSVSGVMNGIRILSSLNSKVYFLLLIFVFIFGPTMFILNFGTEAYGSYLQNFFRMSLANGAIDNDSFHKSWPIFYWCNWLAWTPVTAVFLGKILKGFTIKEAIKCNFIIPAVFSSIWMSIFSCTSIYYELKGYQLYDILLNNGPEAVIYSIFDNLVLSNIIIPLYLFIVFISFVTASDSNTNAISSLCTKGLTKSNQEAPANIKVVWGISIALVTWILISFAGIDGIKAASNLGGFPNMFLMLIMIGGLLRISNNPRKYDVHKEDYDSSGKPLISRRLPIEK